MKTKLTLWVDRRSIAAGQKWAKHHRSSLSQLVSDFFTRLESAEKQIPKQSVLVKKLSGVIKGKSVSMDDYHAYLDKKYLGR